MSQSNQMIQLTDEFVKAVSKVESLKPSQSDICDALPEENAVETVGIRGEKRIDYEKVSIKNKDGTLNRYGKNLIDLHKPAAIAGSELAMKMQAGEFKATPEQEIILRRRIDPSWVHSMMKRFNLTQINKRFHKGITVADETGIPNLYLNSNGRLVRVTVYKGELKEYPA